jgi:hypothetical protein
MFKIKDIVRPLHLLGVAVLLHVCFCFFIISYDLVECERLLAEEEEARPKVEIVKQPNGSAYTPNPML